MNCEHPGCTTPASAYLLNPGPDPTLEALCRTHLGIIADLADQLDTDILHIGTATERDAP